MRLFHLTGICFLLFFLTNCVSGGFDSAKKTNQLRPGMHYDEVVKLLGPPESSQVVKGKWIVRWELHQSWKGNVPYNFDFNSKTKRLISWKEDEKGYQENQKTLAALAAAIGLSGGGAGGDPGPNNPQIMQAIAGRWFSFSGGGTISGGTSRNLLLCANGTYTWGTESGYSTNAGSYASQSNMDGRWAVQGNRQQGTITLAPSNGETEEYEYKVCETDKDGCLYIGGYKYGWAHADCR